MKRVSLVDSIVDEIKKRILSGELKDGDMLESQDEMAKSMQVSRPSLREALRRLQLMGLVESKHGLGTFVKTVEPKDFMTPISSFLPVDKKSVSQLLEARLYLEGAVSSLAAKKATKADIQALENAIKVMESAAANLDVEEFSKVDAKFHVLIADACRNKIMFQVTIILRDLLQNLILRVFDTNRNHIQETFSDTIDNHRRILESIKAGSESKARVAMEKHIKDVQQKMERNDDYLPTGPKNDKLNRH